MTQINYAKQGHISMTNLVSITLAVVFTDVLMLTPFSLQLSNCAHVVTFVMREKDEILHSHITFLQTIVPKGLSD